MFTNNFDPIAFQIFSLEIRWYSLAYIMGILLGWLYCKKQLIKEQYLLVIFDDFITEGKKILEILKQYAIIGRKKHCTCCYLTQAYYAVDNKLRQQCSYLVLLNSTNQQNLNLIATTLSSPVSRDTIKKIIGNATKESLNVCLIDICNPDFNKVFRRNFYDYYEIIDENGDELTRIKMYIGSGILN